MQGRRVANLLGTQNVSRDKGRMRDLQKAT